MYREINEEQLVVLKSNARLTIFWLADIEVVFQRGCSDLKYVVPQSRGKLFFFVKAVYSSTKLRCKFIFQVAILENFDDKRIFIRTFAPDLLVFYILYKLQVNVNVPQAMAGNVFVWNIKGMDCAGQKNEVF